MIDAKNQKIVGITSPAAVVDNAAFTTNTIDTRGFRYITIVLILGALDVALAACKLREGNLADMSDAVDVAGADFAAAPNALPSATDDNKQYAIQVDMRGRKRYLDLSLTGGDGTVGTYATAFAILSRAETMPSSPSDRGFAGEINV